MCEEIQNGLLPVITGSAHWITLLQFLKTPSCEAKNSDR